MVGLPVIEGYRAGLAELVRGVEWAGEVELGARGARTVPLGERESVACVQSGLWLVRDAEGPLVVMLKSVDHGRGEPRARGDGAERERGGARAGRAAGLMRERNVYRGRVLELRSRHFHDDEGAPLTVAPADDHARADHPPAGVLERIERQAFGIAEHAERLRERPAPAARPAAARPAGHRQDAHRDVPRRGDARPHRRAADRPEPRRRRRVVDLATALQPAMVILEDVDLVAVDRAYDPTNAILFELLNGMDGLDEDHDVLFVLTTNRADLLEPALAARPGRIDQAVELPLPDADGRRACSTSTAKGLELAWTGDER